MYGIAIAADSGSVVTSALQLFSQFAIIGGGLWAVWGVITLAGGLKDQNGPATQSGVWQVVGGGRDEAAARRVSRERHKPFAQQQNIRACDEKPPPLPRTHGSAAFSRGGGRGDTGALQDRSGMTRREALI